MATTSTRTLDTLDHFIARLLRVTPPPANTIEQPTDRDSFVIDPAAEMQTVPASAAAVMSAPRAERAFSFALLFSGVRCILMYAILPFVLPIIGIAGTGRLYIDIAINLVAIGAIIYSLRRFWAINYSRKWQYLPIALVAFFIIGAFLVLDVSLLLAPSA